MHFSTKRSKKCGGESLQGVIWSYRLCTLPCLLRRAVGGVVVTLLSNGHRLPLDGAQHLCLSGTFAPDK